MKPKGPKPAPIEVSEKQRGILQEITSCRHSGQGEVLRARIILNAASDMRNEHIAQRLGTSRRAVKLWRKRWNQASEALAEVETKDDGKSLRKLIGKVLSDAPRRGAPPKFTAEQVCQIIAVACESTESSDRPVAQWSSRELADEVIKRSIVSSISVRSVGRFLKSGGSKTSQIPLLVE